MSIIHGSMGIMYFVHEWEPSFREDGSFRYPEIVQGVREINGWLLLWHLSSTLGRWKRERM